MAEEKEEVLSSKKVSEMLGISLATLNRRVRASEIVPLPKAVGAKRHHRLQFPKSEIEAIINKAEDKK